LFVALALLAAVFHLVPGGPPFFSVFKRAATGEADFGGQLAFAEFGGQHGEVMGSSGPLNGGPGREVLGNFRPCCGARCFAVFHIARS